MNKPWSKFLSDDEQVIVSKFENSVPFGGSVALLVVDVYEKAFGSASSISHAQRGTPRPSGCGLDGRGALPKITALVEAFRKYGSPIAFTTGSLEIEAALGAATRRPRTPADFEEDGYRIRSEVRPLPGDWIVQKPMASAFFGTALNTWLTQRRIDTVVVAGESTSGCIRATVVDAFSHGYRVHVAADAVFDRIAVSHAASLLDMHMKYASVSDTSEVLQAAFSQTKHSALGMRDRIRD